MKRTNTAETLLNALTADTVDAAYAALAVSRAGTVQLSEIVQTWPNRDLDSLCRGILNQVKIALGTFHAEAADDEDEAVFNQKQEEAEETLIGLVSLIKAIVEQHGKGAVSSALQEAAQHLHDQAILMADGAAGLQEAVVRLCSLWWHKDLPSRDNMVPQMIPYLLYQATVSGKAADVKRCYAARGALTLLDFDDPSIQGVQALMVRAAMLPPFLRSSDGRKFIAHLFTVHPKMVYELTAVILNQVVSGRKSVLDAYGEIVFKAWRGATGACLERIETHLIQNSLIKSALRASSPALAASLRRVLDGLHSQRLTPGTDAMMLRLYHPLLFRDLAAANAGVRNNAMHLLVDVFPLQDSSAPPEECDEVLQRQFEELSRGLSDEAPAVRITAAGGVCSVLNVYWELLPAAVTATYLKRLTENVAHDSASPGVRQAVVQGLIGLVDNPLAQPLLKLILPRLGPMLHDPALKVRVAMADLLLSVMRVRELHFVDIVDVQQLLEVMAHDAAPVVERIQKLLLPSYFPEGEEGPVRVAMLLRQDPLAGQAFCACLVNSPSGVPMERTVDLASALLGHLLSSGPAPAAPDAPAQQAKKGAAKAAQQAKKKKGRKRKEGAEVPQAEDHSQETMASWQAILGGLAELCTGLAPEQNRGTSSSPHPCEGLFQDDDLMQLLDMCQTVPARILVLRIAAALSGSACAVPIQSRCTEEIMRCKEATALGSEELLSMLRCSLGWQACAASLGRALLKALQAAAQGRSTTSGRDMHLVIAVRCLDESLQHADLRAVLLESGLLRKALPLLRQCITGVQGPLAALTSALDTPSRLSSDTNAQPAATEAANMSPTLLQLYCRTAIHLQLAAAKGIRSPLKHSPADAHGHRGQSHSPSKQVSAERSSFGQQQADVVAEEEARQSVEGAPGEDDEGNKNLAAAAESAVQEGCQVVLKLLGQLQEIGPDNVAELALAARLDAEEPCHKKSRPESAASHGNLSLHSCIQACYAAARALMAVATDAMRILQWTCSFAPVAACFHVALTMLQWAAAINPPATSSHAPSQLGQLMWGVMRMVTTWQGHPHHLQGHPHDFQGPAHQHPGQSQNTAVQSRRDSPHRHALSPAATHSQSVTQLYPAADMTASASVCETVAACEACERVEQVSESIIQQGITYSMMCIYTENYMPDMLVTLTRHGKLRWLMPIADKLGKVAMQHAAATSGAQSAEPSAQFQADSQNEATIHRNDISAAADLVESNKENVSVNQPACRPSRGRKAATLSRQEELLQGQPHYVPGIVYAAETGKVQHLVAGQALQVASQCWHEQRVATALGALVLVDLLDITGLTARRQGHNKQELHCQLHSLCSAAYASADSCTQAVLFRQKLKQLQGLPMQ